MNARKTGHAQSAVGRFAPSTTGPAHPGTLLAALLCWLDARARDGRVVLRLEDLDPERSTPARVAAMQRGLEWLGLDWDAVELQSANTARFDAALDALAALGLLYPCRCSRRELRENFSRAVRAPRRRVVADRIAARARPNDESGARELQLGDAHIMYGGVRYPGTCRARALPAAGWRAAREPLRFRLPDTRVVLFDESGAELSQNPLAVFGDPIVRRRDRATGYTLASVVDDAAAGVTRVVRGRDLAPQSATQTLLRRALALPAPQHRHHLLLLEPRGDKLAKLHGAIGLPELRRRFQDAQVFCGFLAHAAGLLSAGESASPRELLASFSWQKVARKDHMLRVTKDALLVTPAP